VLIAAAAIAGATAGQASAVTCAASDAATFKTKLADNTCDTINLSAGNYDATSAGAFFAGRSVTINGAGAGTTILTRTPTGSIFAANASGIAVSLNGVTVSGAVNGSAIVVSTSASLSISNSVITNNSGNTSGAGITNQSTSPTALNVTDSVISTNSESSFQGGGVYNANTGPARFNRVLFSDNHSTGAGGGGAFSNGVSGATASFTNVTFRGNTANGNGGAISNITNTTADFNNVTILGNTANNDNAGNEAGGGLYEGNATVTMRNSIISTNTDPGTANAPDCYVTGGSLTRLGYELIGTPGPQCTFGGTGDTATGYLTGNPGLSLGLASNGGFSQTLALQTGSQSIDAGNPATPGSGGNACDAVDQRGLPRGGTSGVCDLGAFEVQGNHPLPPAAPGPATTAPTIPKKKCKKKHKRSAAIAKKCKKKRK
jgi:predicted outer membrane repeat protein